MTQDDEGKLPPEDGRATIKRPSLFVIRGILENVEKGIGHRARFQVLAKSTPELRNRMKLVQYLEFLVNDLGWLEREEVDISRWNPMRRNRHGGRWIISRYRVTDLGRSFLALFRNPRVLDGGGEGLPTPEEQAKNWKEWSGLGNSG